MDKLLFLKHFEKIDDHFINESMQPWITQKKKMRRYRLNYYKKVLAACIILAILIGGMMVYHKELVYAWEKITSYIEQILDIQKDTKEYTDFIDESVSSDGITITLKEVVADEENLWIAYTVENDDTNAELPLLLKQMKVNGLSAELVESYETTIESVNMTVDKFSLVHNAEKNEKMSIKMDIQFMQKEKEAVYGSCVLEYETEMKNLEADTKIIPLSEEISLDNGKTMNLIEFRNNIFHSCIKGNMEKEDGVDYCLIGEDDQGNRVEYNYRGYLNENIFFYLSKYGDDGKSIPSDVRFLTLQLYILKENGGMSGIKTEEAEEDTTYLEFEGREAETNEILMSSVIPVGDKFKIELKNN